MAAGAEPEDILGALGLDASVVETLSKFNIDQPRKPAGAPGAGQWTDEAGVAGYTPSTALLELPMEARVVPPVQFQPSPGALAQLSRQGAKLFGRLGARILPRAAGPYAAVHGLGYLWVKGRFNPPKKIEGEVRGAPGLRFVYYPDEIVVRLFYRGRVLSVQPGPDGLLRDPKGVIVGRAVRDDIMVIDPAAVSRELAQDDEPKLCPKPSLDKPGHKNIKDLDYEDYVKRHINPGFPTPRGLSVVLHNPLSGNPVHYDDCQRQTGIMIEAKGTGYAKIISAANRGPFDGITDNWLSQSESQIQAAKGRPVQWYFAEPLAAAYAKGLFKNEDEGRETIEIIVLPWSEGMK